jgi:arylsulfatase A-like enzyme
MQESTYENRVAESHLPDGAPNVLIILIDDAGPGLPDTFGGEVTTDTLSRVHGEGVGFNRFHTTAMCSPTRASLMTGRNHHRIGNGQIAELANDWDGYAGEIPKSSALCAEVLRDYGYSTAAFGKWHNTPAIETTQAGPFHNWPSEIGFEYFYGFLAGEASQYEPNLVRNTTSVLPPKTPEEGYHLSEDLADDAIGWLQNHQALAPDKPFFMYWATGCLHAPHHVTKEWADKYKGKFDDGWDAYRERVFARAKEKGWIPEDAKLTPRDPQMPAWDDVPEEQRPFQRRLMEVAAGFAEHADVQAGRVLDELDRLGVADDTLIFYIWGDNGSSGEGQNGTISELLAQNGIPTTVDMHIETLEQMGGLDLLGTPKVDNQYHAGWAWAGSTPYPGMKLMASDLGGTRNPLAVRWPAKVTPDPTPRSQFHHCNDVVPTIYEAIGIEPPRFVNGVEQIAIDGTSFAYALNDPESPGRLITQYFEIMGSRAIYHDGWLASATGPRLPWVPGLPEGIAEWTPDQEIWRLYNLDEDWSQADDLAVEQPEKLAQMKETFAIEAARNSVFPIGGGAADLLALPRVDLRPPHHPDARVLCSGAGQPRQPGDDRGRPARERERRPLRTRQFIRRTHGVSRRRPPLLRVQPLHHPADQGAQRAAAARWADEDRDLDRARRGQAGGPAEDRADRGRRGAGLRRGPDQRRDPLHRQRLPRHRHLPRGPGLARLLRPRPVPLRGHDRHGQGPLHVRLTQPRARP